jgi:hypothetical protein
MKRQTSTNMARTRTLPQNDRQGLLTAGLILAITLMGTSAMAQGKLVDQRDQAEGWYLPMIGQVYTEGKKTNDYKVELYKDNQFLGEKPSGRKGRFRLELDIDAMYTVRITKPGFQQKLMYIDTTLPEQLVEYPDYELYVNLQPYNAKNIDPFYTDFPSAIIRWNEDMGGFYHSDHYLTHIQTKLAGFASATF